MTMNTKKLGYGATTGITGLAFLAGGAADIAASPTMVAAMSHLGYPSYFATILGVWKVLGAVALLVPRFPRLKEWAYAGIFFDLSGAALSHGISGDGLGKVVTPLALLTIAAASWALRPDSRKLAAAATVNAHAQSTRLGVVEARAVG